MPIITQNLLIGFLKRVQLPHETLYSLCPGGVSTGICQTGSSKGGHFGEGGFMFLTSEHEYVFLKALTFGDLRVMKTVLRTVDPAKVKQLGLEVSQFREDAWCERRYTCMLQAVYNKFSQSHELTKLLLGTGSKYLVESAQYDRIFSIGIWEWKQGDSEGCKIDECTFDVPPISGLGRIYSA